MKTYKSIGILGCGWLGSAVAKQLILKGFHVKGTATSKKGVNKLSQSGVEAYKVILSTKSKIQNLDIFLKDLDILIIAIPPKTKDTDFSLFKALESMFNIFDFSNIKKLIYVSSTGVFMDMPVVEYNEDSPPNNTSSRGNTLISLENLILGLKIKCSKIILRYGGLIKNNDRHPVYYLTGKKNLANPNAPVNLIEQTDAVNLMIKILESKRNLPIYHGVFPFHPTRKNYYTQKAMNLNLELPEFEMQTESIGKTISSKKTEEFLNFEFISPI